MSMRHTITVLPIPHAIDDDGALTVSLVLAPRLSDAGRLGAFPDWLDWTTLLAEEAPRCELRFGSVLVPAEIDRAPLQPRLWKALFDQNTPVERFEFDDRTESLVVSYDTTAAVLLLREIYQSVIAGSPGQLPSGAHTRDAVDAFAQPDVTVDVLARELADRRLRRLEQQKRGGESSSGVAQDFALFQHMPQPGPKAPDVLPRTPQEQEALLDFHQALTALSSYPALLRALGLVLEARVAPGLVPPAGTAGFAPAALSCVGFDPARGWHDKPTRLPASVLYRHHPPQVAPGPPLFFAVERDGQPSEIVEGWLGLEPREYDLIDIDVDGGLIKISNLAATLRNPNAGPDVDGALPALRSGGLALARRGRGDEFVRALRRAAEINAGMTGAGGDVFGASDLVRGYRLDVWSSHDGRWRSLHEREGTYLFGADDQPSVETFAAKEEGFVQLAAASPVADPTRKPPAVGPPIESDLYVHERLARWTGWSLSAALPGRALHRDPSEHDALAEDPTTDTTTTAFKLRTRFSPLPGTLPALRYGRAYRFRVRVVDLAGNSPRPGALDSAPVTAPQHPVSLPSAHAPKPYLRYEPVPHPQLVLRATRVDSARPALDRLVIRSFNSDPSLDSSITTDKDERHVAPPRTSVDTVEKHGGLDDLSGRLRGDAATFADVVARSDATFAVATVGEPPTQVPIEPGPRVPIDYWPDPLARRAALRSLPGVGAGEVLVAGAGELRLETRDPEGRAGPVLFVDFGARYPSLDGFRLELVEGEGAPRWEPSARVLTIALPKAGVALVPLSSAFAEADLAVLGVWAWQREDLIARADAIARTPGGDLADRLELHARLAAELHRLALEGGQWALTPATSLQLIHAVQQPIGRPAFVCTPPREPLPSKVSSEQLRPSRVLDARVPLSALRRQGRPEATLIGALTLHHASTARIDLVASWSDPVDDAPSGVREAFRHDVVEPLLLGGPARGAVPAEGVDPFRAVGVFHDPDRITFDPAPPGSPDPAAPIHRFEDTRHRVVTYKAIATSRFKGDFPQDETTDFTRTSEPVIVSVPNCASPIAPRLASVRPIFGWRRESGGTLTSSVREGRALRVFLERPWFQSGPGELLGVVLWRRGELPPGNGDRRTRYVRVTQWGLDAVRAGGSLPLMPGLEHFPEASVRLEGVRVPGIDQALDVAGHEVHFDAERGLWYADIVFDAKEAYFPFVRLGLVRLQPESISGAEASASVSASFLQLAPDRAAVLVADPSLPNLYRLVVSGIAAEPSTLAPWRSVIDVEVQRRDQARTGDLAWSSAGADAVLVTRTTPPVAAPAVLYTGLVEFTAAPERDDFRLVIREYEIWQVDKPERARAADSVSVERASPALAALQAESPGASSAGRFQASALALKSLERLIVGPTTGRRLVYAEFMPVEPSAHHIDPSTQPPPPAAGGVGEGQGTPDEPGQPGGPGQPPVAAPPEPGPPPWPSTQAPTDPFQPAWEQMPAEPNDPFTADGAVKLAQALLNAATSGPPLSIDGKFGALTQAMLGSFLTALGFPAGATLDPAVWLALAVAAPFPRLEPGTPGPAMQGPPVLLVQRLLNRRAETRFIDEDGAFSPATVAGVRAFQGDNALPETGVVDLETWEKLADLLEETDPMGAEVVTIDFDRARLDGGEAGFIVEERRAAPEQPVPASEPLDADFSGRAGFWLELRDGLDQLLFRRVLGQDLAGGAEHATDDAATLAHEDGPLEHMKLRVLLPRISVARTLVIFGNLTTGTAAEELARFAPWEG
jgi:hypothetical protein